MLRYVLIICCFILIIPLSALQLFTSGSNAAVVYLTPLTSCLAVEQNLHVTVYGADFSSLYSFTIPTPPQAYTNISITGLGTDFDTDSNLEVMYQVTYMSGSALYIWDTVTHSFEQQFATSSTSYSGWTYYLGNERVVIVWKYGTTNTVSVYRSNVQTPLQDEEAVPVGLSGFPNPCQINSQPYQCEFELKQPDTVSINVYNIKGQKVRSLLNNVNYPSGKHGTIWDGMNDSNQPVGSGLYLIELQSNNTKSFIKTIIMP